MKLSTISLVFVAVLLTGCASPARVEQMTAAASPAQRIASTPLKKNVAVKDITGGKETNPAWVSNVGNGEFEKALEASLQDAGLLSEGKQLGKYTLIAHIMKMDQPLMGFDMTVTATVQYTLVERASGKTVLSREIALPFTATISDAFSGVERLRLANEGAVRSNIKKLIEELFAVGADKVALN